jgi:hypothetical protein
MNSQHTPGPWEQDCNVVRTTRGTIALCPVPQKGGVFDCSANALLIAAAPDMLAALLNVRKIISEGALTGFNPLDGDWAERLYASQHVTSSAIRKATK